MSGLVGWVDSERDLRGHSNVIHAMTATMRMRGPDSEKLWISQRAALGCCESGAGQRSHPQQPLHTQTDRGLIAVAFAGDIYNASELRRELQSCGAVFRTDSIPELLTQSYLLWGTDFISRFNGTFGFAVWDERVGRLLLGRDRMGVKPLYYAPYPGGILFASEPKGILANPLFVPRLDISALPIVLQPRLALPGETPLLGLHEVPPAHIVTYSDQSLSQYRYWELVSEPHLDSFEKTARHVRELLDDTVSRQLPSSVSCGAMLSGGVDSTSVAALAVRKLAEQERVLDTFCLQFEGASEHFTPSELRPDIDAPYAAAAAEYLGTRHTTLSVPIQDLASVIPQTRQARDLPAWGQFDASMYLLFNLMRNSCAVALSGEAADEFFGGYPFFFKPDVIERDEFPWMGHGPRLSRYLSADLLALIKPEEDERARYSELISRVPRLPGEDTENARMREIHFLVMSGPLAVVLDRKERMSMSQGLEVRVPFCDHRLVQYVWNVPWSMKSTGGVKGLLKAAMSDILPPCTVSRRKSAYPHVQNPEYDAELVREATWIVNDPASPIAEMFDTTRLNTLISEVRAGVLHADLPGGANPAYLLIQLVEMYHWINDYKISVI